MRYLPTIPLMIMLLALAAAVFTARAAQAQTAPSRAELAAYSGLHAAAAMGDVPAIAALIAAKADLEARDAMGRTAFLIAAHQRKPAAMKALAKGGADVNALDSQRYDAVTIAAVADDSETLQAALELGNRPGNVTSPYDGTALIAAAHLGHDVPVRMLIRAGAPLDHVNNLGWTALMEAVILGDGGPRHAATVKALVDAGADRGIADRNGLTPLDHAKARGFAGIVALLSG
jgi:ankyrin repeat protein